MIDESTKTLTATFETREAADLAIEHLVQVQLGPGGYIRASGWRVKFLCPLAVVMPRPAKMRSRRCTPGGRD
jgi:hypothetical protein